jgi:hypothetical protein
MSGERCAGARLKKNPNQVTSVWHKDLVYRTSTYFCKNENKSWMVEARYFFKNQKCLAKNLNKLFCYIEVFIKNAIFSMHLMII